MIAQNYADASNYIAALTGSSESVMDWRLYGDVKADPRIENLRGTLAQLWDRLVAFNNTKMSVCVIVNQSDGMGREAQNITAMRAAFVDLDEGDIPANYARLIAWSPRPHMIVSTSPGKYHFYWLTQPYNDPAKFTTIQRKLVAEFQGDHTIVDPPRIMRVPGFVHNKAEPSLVALYAGPAWGSAAIAVDQLGASLAHVSADAGGSGLENELGDPRLAAPSFKHAVDALNMVDPDNLEYDEWRDLTFAFKQAIWTHTTPTVAKIMWDAWTRRSSKNEINESEKLWRSAKKPRSGWPALRKRSGYAATEMFGNGPGNMPAPVATGVPGLPSSTPALPNAPKPNSEPHQVFMMAGDQAAFFKGFTYIVSLNQILTPQGVFLDSARFNNAYGGRIWIIDETGEKTTPEAWKAATQGQVYRVPQVHFTRFLPNMSIDDIIVDEFGRAAINMYRPAYIEMMAGDASPFVNHLRKLLPIERDVMIFLSYLAHCVQRPGSKAAWAPLVQSAEGAGKGVIKECLIRAVGRSYVHAPNARELGEGGGKFNGWMEGKLLIVADEIRVDDKRDMIEVLKPMITEKTLEIQRKGVDQIIGDNVSNWVMFSNYKDAIPITADSRRFAIFYSPLQSKADLDKAGMGDQTEYFPRLWDWLEKGGYKIVAHYLKYFEIPEEFDPTKKAHRAPATSSLSEALVQSLGRYEQQIAEAIEEGKQGFKGGWVSSWAISNLLGNKPGPHVIRQAMKTLGYHMIGRNGASYFQENHIRSTLYNKDQSANMADYGSAQGYS